MNRYRPHVYVIPEDDCDRQIADGFILHPRVHDAQIQVVPPAGGWSKVLKTFRDEYVPKLREYPYAHVVMLIDFDGQFQKRTGESANDIPDELRARVFVIGPKETPELLKSQFRMSFEKVGEVLADDCYDGASTHWQHEQLGHNEAERQRLILALRPFLF